MPQIKYICSIQRDMRILSLICVLMIMALNLVPCADAHGESEAQVSISSSSPDNHHDFPVEDGCSPFCHCACCSSQVVVRFALILSVPFSMPSATSVNHPNGRSNDISLAIWQPPKLG